MTLSIWTVCQNPRDFPGKFTARRHVIDREGAAFLTNDLFVADTLEEVRAMLPPGLYMWPRCEEDNPVIVEVWL